jgi:intracellular sulfur oxidation DsrE/DsrF family protein
MEVTKMYDNSSTVILITRDGMGDAEKPLQHTLICKYLQLLIESEMLPAVICFYTDGVKLVVEGSPVIEQLRSLESKGVHLVVCSTCLRYFGLQDMIKVGIPGGMTDIIEAQFRAERVISI